MMSLLCKISLDRAVFKMVEIHAVVWGKEMSKYTHFHHFSINLIGYGLFKVNISISRVLIIMSIVLAQLSLIM